ncbi:succinate dehydrogenase, hydrophobic membrane anchor protein [Legionella sp. W05-934-2]|jgi:succinate dehydrogenase / fumarate reductase membrane anchor subunit|uniref:succinate dehydrogenase, hydrophobic membrane anchor protein n=1 Tax=Legionella sp. W05-934-2 TaxID=1198649 RepID=UPI0034628DCE
MVTNVTSLTGNGLKDWLIQRVTAVFLAIYALFLLGFILSHPQLTYQQWLTLFSNPIMKLGSILSLLAVLLHAWVGLWTVTTDYIKPTSLRIMVQMVILGVLLLLFTWGIMILWGL